ncbi:MAG: hypothetical protein WD249_00055 [Gaiellaceae bacterium]
MLFSRRLGDDEIRDYLAGASPYELATFVSSFVLWDSLTDKGKVHAAAGLKVLKKHQDVFAGCDSGAEIGGRVHEVLGRWPDVSPREAAFLSDLVKAHRGVQQQV